MDLEARLAETHPLQYGYRPGSNDPVFDPGDDPTVGERYNRCPVCEQWSPCDVRQALDALRSERERAELAERQLAAVDAALPPWEPPPGSETGCVGRVQTILNLKAERERAEKLREALAEAEPWLLVPSDTYPQHHEALGQARAKVRAALSEAAPAEGEATDGS